MFSGRFALISVVLILFFRYFRSTWGTKFAVLWSELTFVTMLGMLTAIMLGLTFFFPGFPFFSEWLHMIEGRVFLKREISNGFTFFFNSIVVVLFFRALAYNEGKER